MNYLGLPSLQYRRTRADMIEVFKILNDINKADKNMLFHRNTESITRGNTMKLKKRSHSRLDH